MFRQFFVDRIVSISQKLFSKSAPGVNRQNYTKSAYDRPLKSGSNLQKITEKVCQRTNRILLKSWAALMTVCILLHVNCTTGI
jgi:hypothetical protein